MMQSSVEILENMGSLPIQTTFYKMSHFGPVLRWLFMETIIAKAIGCNKTKHIFTCPPGLLANLQLFSGFKDFIIIVILYQRDAEMANFYETYSNIENNSEIG